LQQVFVFVGMTIKTYNSLCTCKKSCKQRENTNSSILEPRGVHVVHFTNFIRHFERPAKFMISQGI